MTVPKAMALRSGMDHGKMLYSADGYVTAWFLYWLTEDEASEKVFIGEGPELLGNPLYFKQKTNG